MNKADGVRPDPSPPIGIAVETPEPGQTTVKVQHAGAGIFHSAGMQHLSALLTQAARHGVTWPQPFIFTAGQVFYEGGRVVEARILGYIRAGQDATPSSLVHLAPEKTGPAIPPVPWATWSTPTPPRLTVGADGFLVLDPADVGRTHLSISAIRDPQRTGPAVAISMLWDLAGNAPTSGLALRSDTGKEILNVDEAPAYLATGEASRRLGRALPSAAWTAAAVRRDTEGTQRGPLYVVRLKAPSGDSVGVGVTLELPLVHEGDPERTILAALARALPDWHTLRIIDLCHSLALADPRKDGGFWYHPARFDAMLGLRGHTRGGRQYATPGERRRFERQFDWLTRHHVEIYKRTHRDDGKGWRMSEAAEWSGPLLARDKAAGTKRLRLHGRLGRPALAQRVKVSDFTFREAHAQHVELTAEGRRFYQLRDGAAYKTARYLFTRARMSRAHTVRETLDQVEAYAGLPRDEIRAALDQLEALGISAQVEGGGWLVAHVRPSALALPARQARPRKRLPAPAGS